MLAAVIIKIRIVESRLMRGIGCVITYPFYFRCLLRKTCLTPALRTACLYVHFSPVMLTFALDSCSGARGRKCRTVATWSCLRPRNVFIRRHYEVGGLSPVRPHRERPRVHRPSPQPPTRYPA